MFRNILSGISTPFEDLVGLARPLWRDVSRYQMYWDHIVAIANGVLGVFARAGISWGYHDPFFRYLYDGAEGLMYRSSYHVLYPGEDIIRQADKVWYVEQPEIDIIPRCIDFEVFPKGITSGQAGDACWNMSELVFSRDGVRPIIYSRYKLIEKYLKDWTPEMLNAHYWFLAQYRWARWLEHSGPPTLPKYVIGGAGPTGSHMINRNNILLHQTADKKIPFPNEVPTPYAGKSIDYDRWEIGTEEQMHQFIKDTWGNGGIIPVPPPPGTRHVKVVAYKLNIRSEPSAQSTDLGTLHKNTDLIVIEEQGRWLKLNTKGWIHGDYVEDV